MITSHYSRKIFVSEYCDTVTVNICYQAGRFMFPLPMVFDHPENDTSFCSGKSIATSDPSPLQIKKDGSCSLSLIATTWGLCETDIKQFPADLHNCTFGFYVHNIYPSTGNHTVSIVKHNSTSINGAWHLKSKIAFLSLMMKQSCLESDLFGRASFK